MALEGEDGVHEAVLVLEEAVVIDRLLPIGSAFSVCMSLRQKI
jgi:hypothetical protein